MSFLCVNENKAELFEFLSQCVLDTQFGDKIVVSTSDQQVVSSSDADVQDLQPCTHEEADTRVILHAAHCAHNGLKKVSIRTVDTDVVVLAVANYSSMDLDELWLAFGTGKHFRHIPAHELSQGLGPLK